MGIVGTVNSDLLSSKSEASVKFIAQQLGLDSTGTKADLIKAILDHQAGRCNGCESASATATKSKLIGTQKGCKNC
jgi:PP-loop superfamily ATP-utilizing enzyme